VLTTSQQLLLYVDGALRKSSTTGQGAPTNFNGYWHAGYSTLVTGWPTLPTSNYFSGTIDEPAIYTYALSATQVSNHFSKK